MQRRRVTSPVFAEGDHGETDPGGGGTAGLGDRGVEIGPGVARRALDAAKLPPPFS